MSAVHTGPITIGWDGLRATTDPDLWFPISGIGPGRAQIHQAVDICNRCPVRQPCLDEVLTWPSSRRDVGMVAGGRYFAAGSDMYDRSSAKTRAGAP